MKILCEIGSFFPVVFAFIGLIIIARAIGKAINRPKIKQDEFDETSTWQH